MEKTYSSRDVAQITGLAHSTIRDYAVLLGVGRKIAGRWIFNDSDVEVIKSRCTERGRPLKGIKRDPIRK